MNLILCVLGVAAVFLTFMTVCVTEEKAGPSYRDIWLDDG